MSKLKTGQAKINCDSCGEFVDGVSALETTDGFSNICESCDNTWTKIEHEKPQKNLTVEVKMSDGEITEGYIDENYQRTCFLVKGSGGAFWRPFINRVVEWRYIKNV